MDNLQQALNDAEWERRAAERQPYRVLAPRAPGAVAYWMAMALVADGAGRDDLVQPALDAAGAAPPSTNLRRMAVEDFAAWLDMELVYVQPYDGESTNASNLVERYFAENEVL